MLRKKIVLRERRGAKPSVAHLLFDTLVERALVLGFRPFYLDTPAIPVASHKLSSATGSSK